MFILCYLNASGDCEAVVTARIRIGWEKFRECRQLLHERKLLLNGRIYHSCVKSAMLYSSKTCCVRENERWILRTQKTKKSNVWS